MSDGFMKTVSRFFRNFTASAPSKHGKREQDERKRGCGENKGSASTALLVSLTV